MAETLNTSDKLLPPLDSKRLFMIKRGEDEFPAWVTRTEIGIFIGTESVVLPERKQIVKRLIGADLDFKHRVRDLLPEDVRRKLGI